MTSCLRRLELTSSCLVIALVYLSSVGCQFISDKDVMTDLSYDVCENALFWPGLGKANGFKSTIVTRGFNEASDDIAANTFYLEVNSVCFPEHVATHMDAPAHFSKGSWRLGQIPLDRMQGRAVVLDIGPGKLSDLKVVKDAEFYNEHPKAVTVDHVLEWERVNGVIEPDSVVLVNTGWGTRYPNWNSFYGAEIPPETVVDTTTLDFPGLSPKTAMFLAKERHVKMVGIDSGSIEVAGSFAVHPVFTDRKIPILELVANLDKLPARGSYVIALPIKLCEGSGGPARVVAYHSGVSVAGLGKLVTAVSVAFYYVSKRLL